MKRFIVFLLTIVLVAGLYAQDMKNIENYRIYKMSEYLDLSSKQAEVFFPLMRQYERDLKNIKTQEEVLYSDLKKKQHSGNISEQELQTAMDRIENLEHKRSSLKRDFMKKSGNVLSPNQVSKIPTFENDFRNHLKQQYKQRQKNQRPASKKLLKGRK